MVTSGLIPDSFAAVTELSAKVVELTTPDGNPPAARPDIVVLPNVIGIS
jgi:hypothetical protein